MDTKKKREDIVPKNRKKKGKIVYRKKRAKKSNTKTHTKKKKEKKARQARLEPRTCAYRGGCSPAEPKYPRGYEKYPRGMIVFHSRKQTPSIQWKPQTGDTKKKLGRETPAKMLETPLFPGIRSFPGDRASRPREGSFRRSPARQVWRWGPFFWRLHLVLPCGAGVARLRSRWGSGGVQENRSPAGHA